MNKDVVEAAESIMRSSGAGLMHCSMTVKNAGSKFKDELWGFRYELQSADVWPSIGAARTGGDVESALAEVVDRVRVTRVKDPDCAWLSISPRGQAIEWVERTSIPRGVKGLELFCAEGRTIIDAVGRWRRVGFSRPEITR